MTIDAIWKESIPVDDREHTFQLPLEAEIVHVGCQNEHIAEIQFWYTKPRTAAIHFRYFRIFGTGWFLPDLEDGSEFVHRGTVLTHGGHYVWHLMERVMP